MVDSTFATPILQRPLDHGATIVLHSGAKFLGGHGDVMAGAVARRIQQVRILTDGILHPMAAYTLHRGLQMLGVRVRAAQENARTLAQQLKLHPGVQRVSYPGFAKCDPHTLRGRQMKGLGSIIALELKEGYAAATRVVAGVRLITPVVSLGSCDTLIQHPAGLTHRIVAQETREDNGIKAGLLRISVGLEDVHDLWADRNLALDSTVERLPKRTKRRARIE